MFDLSTYATAFGGVPWMILFFIIALSIIVAVHEYGHYVVGRWSGIHAEVFSIGFGPVLFSKADKHGTLWQIAALPLGGYVRFKGDANAASGPDVAGLSTLSTQELRTTMHGAPLWARAATAAAGPLFNFIFSIILFTALLLSVGRPTDTLTLAKLVDLPGTYEVKVGDEIVAVEGQAASTFQDLQIISPDISQDGSVGYTVLRDGVRIDVRGPAPFPPYIANVSPQSAAFDAGLERGDVVLEINGTPVSKFTDVQESVALAGSEEMLFTVWRKGQVFETLLSAKETAIPNQQGGFENRYLVGISSGAFFEPNTTRPGVIEALSDSTQRTYFIIKTSLSGLWHMAVGKISTCNISGPISIAQVSGQMAAMGTVSFLLLLAGLSTMIGLMNLLPIPMLDGGHLAFHAYEAIMRRPPSDRAVHILMTAGITIVLFFMVFAITTDVFCP